MLRLFLSVTLLVAVLHQYHGQAQTLTVSYVASDEESCDDGNFDFGSESPSFALLRSTGGVTVYSEGFSTAYAFWTYSSGGSEIVESETDVYYNILSESAGGYVEDDTYDSALPDNASCHITCIYGWGGTGVCREVDADAETEQGQTITDIETDTYTGSLIPLATFIAQSSAAVPTTSSATGSSPGTRSPTPAAPHNLKSIDIAAIIGGAVAGLAVILSSILWAFILRIRRRRLGRPFPSSDPFDVQVAEGQTLAPYSLTGVEQSGVEYQAYAVRKIPHSRRREFRLPGRLPRHSAAVPGPSAQGGSGGVMSDPAWVAQLRAVVERVVEEQLRQNRRESSEAPPEYTTT